MFNSRIMSNFCYDPAKRRNIFDTTIRKRIDNWWRYELNKTDTAATSATNDDNNRPSTSDGRTSGV